MRFFERPGGFRWYYYTTICAKRKQRNHDGWNPSRLRCRLRHIELASNIKDIILKTPNPCYIISHIQHFFNAFQTVADCRPAVMCLRCNVRQREPLNVPQPGDFPVYPPKRCVFDSGCHLLSIKSLQRSGQHYASRRHRQHRARKAAATVRRYAPYCQ